MAGVEAFTILAVLEAKDRISGVLSHVDETLDRFSGTATRAAEAARTAGTAIDESFLQTASGADAAEVADARLAATRAKLFKATQDQAAAERELLTAQAEAATAVDGYAASDARLIAANDRLAASQRAVATASREEAAALRMQAASADTSAASTVAGTTVLGRWGGAATAAGTALRVAGKFAMGAGIAAAAIGYESIKAATSFQTLTTRLITSAGETSSNLKLIQRGILGISTDTATSANELATAMYQVESAGYHGAAGLTVLKAAAQGAKDEGANATTVAKGLTSALNSYKRPASAAALITSQLVTAVSRGRTTFQDFSASLGNVLPIAAAAGVKLQDVTAVMAQMTNQGVSAQRSSQNVARAIQSLESPSGTMKKEFEALGITSQQVTQTLGSKGLQATLELLDRTAQKAGKEGTPAYTEALRKLMGTSAGLNVALDATGKHSKDTEAAIKAIGGASTEAGGNVKGFSEIQKTFGFQMDKAKTAIHNAGIAIGSALLPAVTRVAAAIARVVTPIANWIQHHQKLTAIVLGSLVALGALAAVVWAVAAAVQVLLSPVTLIVVGIAALVAGLVYAYNHFKTFRAIVDNVASFLKTVFVGAWHLAAKAVDAFAPVWDAMVKTVKSIVQWFNDNVLSWIKDRVSDLVSWWKSHSKELTAVWHFVFEFIKTEAKVAFDLVKGWLGVLYQGWKVAWGLIKDTVKLVWGVIKDTVTLAMHTIMNVIGVVLDLITGHWGKAWKDLKKLASDALKDAWRLIKDMGSNAGTLLWDAGKNIIKGLIGGIKSMIGAVGGAISDVVSEVKNHLPWSPAKKGPLSGSGAPEIGGRNIVKLMAQGILTGAPHVEEAIKHVTGIVAAQQSRGGSLAVGAAGGFGGGRGGAGAAGSVVNLNFDLRDSRVMSDRDMDLLVNKIGKQVATRLLPAGGVRIRM
ncbi:phage tail tape measure protein [Streptomyces mirabilis]|uniref:phage tail tape measure protein n=1 Tax=Streptomyces mirabilis TaxID=68239 RepID=UPI00332E862C